MGRKHTNTTDQGGQLGRRTLLTGAGGLALAGFVLGADHGAPALAQSKIGEDRSAEASGDFASFEWLGNAGWRITTPTATLLVDPYLSRFNTGLAAGKFNATTPITVDTDAVDGALGSGNVAGILVTHTHWDHFADVPHIGASRKSTVFTTLTGYHLARSMGLPPAQIAVVKGGEELHIGDAVVRVVPALHSRTGTGGLLFPGVRTQITEPPATIDDLPEGDTLGFIIRRPDKKSGVLLLGASDYDDQSLAGLDVDTVALPVPANDMTVNYVGRLLRALEKPRTVVLVHWDNFETPLSNPPQVDDKTRARMQAVTAEITRVSPHTRVIEPTYLSAMKLL